MAGKLIYDASFNSQTRILSLLDKAGNVISTCEVPSKSNELTLTATVDNSSVQLNKIDRNVTLNNTFEVDTGSGWQSYTFGTVINLNAGQSCKWRCSAHPTAQSPSEYVQFVMAGSIEASGNVNSMLSSDFEAVTEVPPYAFFNLFYRCTSLTKAPELPATTLANKCYHFMFSGCRLLRQAPELPATTLATYCYAYMFEGCTSLTQAPELPATTLENYCYQGMFWDCGSLRQSPELPATNLANHCYQSMFYNCLLLNRVHIAAINISATNCLGNWLMNVSTTGNFYCDPNTNFPSGGSGKPSRWSRWLYGAEDTGTTTTMYHNGSAETVRVGTSNYGTCYALQGWAGFRTLADMHTIDYTLQAPVPTTMYRNGSTTSVDKIEANGADGFTEDMYRVNAVFQTLAQAHTLGYTLQEPVPTTMYYGGAATSVDKIEANGADGFTEDMYRVNAVFQTLAQAHTSGYTFGAQSSLTMYSYDSPVSALSVAANAEDGFTETMYSVVGSKEFSTIAEVNANGYYLVPTPYTGLTLTATASNSTVKLNEYGKTERTYEVNTGSGWKSYTLGTVIRLNAIGDSVKWRCTRLVVTSISNYVYFIMTGTIEASGNCNSMFNKNFDALTGVPPYAFVYLFKHCTSLTKAPELPATDLEDRCYMSMFQGCTRLTKAPELPATTLIQGCYTTMLYGCTALTEVRIAATTTATNALTDWLYNTSATGDFYCDPNATIFPTDSASGIPSGWVRRNIADYPQT